MEHFGGAVWKSVVEQWNSVERYGGTVEQCGGTVKQCGGMVWNSVVDDRNNGTV